MRLEDRCCGYQLPRGLEFTFRVDDPGAPLALGFRLLGIWLINGFYRVGQAVSVAWQWKGRKWADIKI